MCRPDIDNTNTKYWGIEVLSGIGIGIEVFNFAGIGIGIEVLRYWNIEVLRFWCGIGIESDQIPATSRYVLINSWGNFMNKPTVVGRNH